jgi:GTP-binding protein Era
VLEEGVGNKDIGLPVLLVLNKKDLIKPVRNLKET